MLQNVMNILMILLRKYHIKQDPVNETDHLAALKLRFLFVKTDHSIKWQNNNWKILEKDYISIS